MSNGEPQGRVIDGRFALEARLGGGGMGTVWRARDLVLDRAVALKEVRPPDPDLVDHDPAAAAQLRERVLREARALARVDHPNVVTIHHVVDVAEHPYPWLVMELVTGGSLADRLDRGAIDPVAAARLGQEVLAALDAAHEAGIQHRDVKPANVLLRPDGRPVLTDFGIAAIRESATLTATGSVIGTPDYMAPERISGGDGGPESDLWSLAMMLYVAVEGRHPLRRASTLATLAAVLNDEVPPPRQAGVLQPLLEAVLRKDPALRPDAAAVHRLLAEAAAAPGGAAAAAATSYHLPPPRAATEETPAPAPAPAPPSGQSAASARTGPSVEDAVPPPAGQGTASGRTGSSVQDAIPAAFGSAAWAGPGEQLVRTGADVGEPAASAEAGKARARRLRRWAFGLCFGTSAVAGTLLLALMWGGGEDDPDGGAAGSPGTEQDAPAGGAGDADGEAEPVGDQGQDDDAEDDDAASLPNDLITPDGAEAALEQLVEASGSDRLESLVIYPEFVSANVLIDEVRYDSWSVWYDRGPEKGIISSSMSGSSEAIELDEIDWDVLEDLVPDAEEALGVENAATRYLVVNAPSSTFDTPLGLSYYMSDDYGVGGYARFDLDGDLVRVVGPDD